MPVSESDNQFRIEMDGIKNRILDSALLVGIILGMITYSFLIIRIVRRGFLITDFVDAGLILFLIFLYLFRQALTIRLKVILILVILFAFIYTDVFKSGVQATNHIFLILIAHIGILYYRQKVTILIFSIGVAIYIFMGYLITEEILTVYFTSSDKTIISWIIYALIITITTIPTIYYNANYSKIVNKLILDLNKKNRELSEREANLKSIFESTNHIVGLFDRELNLVEFNQSFVRYAKQADNLDLYKGMPILDLMNRPQAELFRGFLRRALKGEKFSELVEYPVQDGVLYFMMSYNPIKEDNKVTGVSMFVQDVTELKQAEQMVIKERDFTNKILDLFPSVFYMYEIIDANNNDIKLIRWNRNHEVMLGYSSNELFHKKASEFFNEKEVKKFDHLLDDIIQDGQGSVQANIRHKNGKEIPFLFVSTILKENNMDYFMGFGIDISDRVKAEQELIQYKDRLEKLVKERTEELILSNRQLRKNNREIESQRKALEKSIKDLKKAQMQLVQSEKMVSLGILSAGVGHEINNPLNFIKNGFEGLAVELQSNGLKLSRDTYTYIDIVREGIDRMSTIVKSLSQFSRQTDKSDEECDLHNILDNCLIMLQNETKHKALIEKQYSDVPVIIKGNSGKLHQAFLNILVNAVHAIKNEGEISLKSEVAGNKIVITISDDGTGIAQEDIPKIFDPFFTRKETGKGTGLGLSITNSIIHEHNGEIMVNSQVNKGTTFKIIFQK